MVYFCSKKSLIAFPKQYSKFLLGLNLDTDNIGKNKIEFPYSKGNINEGNYELYIPTSAITIGNQIKGKIVNVINTNDKKLYKFI